MATEVVRQKVSELNNRLNIKFEKPGAEFLSSVQTLVDRMASVIGVPTPQLQLPIEGFLNTPLDKTQKTGVENELGPLYAQESVDFQEKLMQIPIVESGERMVPIEMEFAALDTKVSFSEVPFTNAALYGWDGKAREYWTREGVAEKLKVAARALNEIGLMLHFEDGFRPVGVQEGLLKRRIVEKILTEEHPDWDPVKDFDKIMVEAQSKTAIMPKIAGHKGGAAIDATLRTIDGTPLPLGNQYGQGGAAANLDYPYVTAEEWQTRMLFKSVMEMAGMTVYPGEDWHASYGDNLAGANPDGSPRENYVAKYGPVKGFFKSNGKVIPYAPVEYDQPFFTRDQLKEFALQARSK
jgi:D-alanyl-D-alanine dipeptidase